MVWLLFIMVWPRRCCRRHTGEAELPPTTATALGLKLEVRSRDRPLLGSIHGFRFVEFAALNLPADSQV